MKRIHQILLWLVIWASTAPASATELRDVRTGFHHTFSRVVIELDRPVRYQIIEDVANRKVLVDLHYVDDIAGIGEVKLEPGDPFLKQVRYYRTRRFVTVSIDLLTADAKINAYSWGRPFRVILDISRKPDNGSVVTQQSTTQDVTGIDVPARQPNPDDRLDTPPPEQNLSEPTEIASLLDSTLQALKRENLPVDALLHRAGEKQEPQEDVAGESTSNSEAGAKLFYAFLALFLIVDGAALMWYLRRHSRPTKQPAKRKRSTKSRHTASKQGVQVDGREFVNILKTTLQERMASRPAPVAEFLAQQRPSLRVATPADDLPPEQAAELAEINSAIKIDSFIESLSEAVETAANPVMPPRLQEVAQDLDSISASAHISRELSEEQIIGRDGAEFMKNIKRLYMN